jgi:hypothetical protein
MIKSETFCDVCEAKVDSTKLSATVDLAVKFTAPDGQFYRAPVQGCSSPIHICGSCLGAIGVHSIPSPGQEAVPHSAKPGWVGLLSSVIRSAGK